MTPERTLRVRSLWLAVFAAFCVVAFGAVAHSPSADTGGRAFAMKSPAGGAVLLAKSALRGDAAVISRTVVTPGIALHAPHPAVALGFLTVGLTLAAGWLVRSRRSLRRPSAGRTAAPARAPPLAC